MRILMCDCEYSTTSAGVQQIRTLPTGVRKTFADVRIRTLVCEKRQLLLVCEFAHWCAKKKTPTVWMIFDFFTLKFTPKSGRVYPIVFFFRTPVCEFAH